MEIFDIEETLNSELKSDFKGMKDGFVQVGNHKWFYPMKYREIAEELNNFEIRSDDIWIMGYPRSGTTLTEELVWQLSHNIGSEGKQEDSTNERVGFFELSLIMNAKTVQDIQDRFPQEAHLLQEYKDNLKILNSYERRRVIKTHLPFELLPPDILKKGCKVIYLCRHPKDVCVSYFHLQSNNRFVDFCGDFQKFWWYFRNGYSMFGPYFEHVKQGFERIGSPNFMFAFYEEFKKDNIAYIQKLSQFLDIPITDSELKELQEFIQIDNFQRVRKSSIKDNNNETIKFIRSGKVGGWRDHFTQEMSDDADAWIEMNSREIGIKYPPQI